MTKFQMLFAFLSQSLSGHKILNYFIDFFLVKAPIVKKVKSVRETTLKSSKQGDKSHKLQHLKSIYSINLKDSIIDLHHGEGVRIIVNPQIIDL